MLFSIGESDADERAPDDSRYWETLSRKRATTTFTRQTKTPANLLFSTDYTQKPHGTVIGN
jgi:hypothetical protein